MESIESKNWLSSKNRKGNKKMLQDPLTLYKLIVLYMLNRVTFPLTTAQISDFILDKEYTNFLTLQQVISELTDAGMVSPIPSATARILLSLRREKKLFNSLKTASVMPSKQTSTPICGKMSFLCETKYPFWGIIINPPPANTKPIWLPRTEASN